MKKFLLPLILIISVLSGCGGKDKVKPSADSLLTTEAVRRLEAVRTAYQEKDIGAIRTLTEEGLAEGILKDLNFEKADLLFIPKVVRITDEFITVSLNWQGSWHSAKGKDLENRGVADLVLQRADLKLIRIDGDNPFVVPAIKE